MLVEGCWGWTDQPGGQQEADKHAELRIGSDIRNEVSEKSNFRSNYEDGS